MTLLAKFSGLSTRLIALMTLALLPLGLISLYQTRSVVERADDLARSALIAQTERAVAAERKILIEAVGAGKGLGAAILPILDDPERCSEILSDFIAQNPHFVFAGFLPVDGYMVCSSAGQPFDFSEYPGFAEAIAAPRLNFEVNERGTASRQSVMISNLPVYRAGVFMGFISMSIPHTIANNLLPAAGDTDRPRILVMNRDDRIISASDGLADAEGFLPLERSVAELRAQPATTFQGPTRDGEQRVFASFTLLEDEVVVVGSWPVEALRIAQGPVQALVTVLFPILMWLAGILVAFFGLHRLVIRHIRDLRDAMRRFALGERDMSLLVLDTPSEEFDEAQRAFNRMARILTQAEARREQDLHDKEVLLREVHHRVKNNLQMIASMMNMQSRAVHTPEAKRVLRGLQRRVQGLAAIHRTLYTTPDMTTVDVASLADEMVREVTSMAGAGTNSVKIVRDLQPMQLYPDQAVPLSMVLSEMLTNAVKYIGAPEQGPAEIQICLAQADDGEISLSVENTKGIAMTDADPGDSTGIGSRLMRAFVVQLEGQQEVIEEEDRYRITVRFQPSEFSPDAA